MILSVEERIRWSDMDTAGIMYFGNYIRLFEIAETELFRAAGFPYSDSVFESEGIFMLRASFHCDFHQPIFLDDLAKIEIWVGKIGAASMTLNFRVSRDSTALGSGYCAIVSVSRKTRKPIKIPLRIRDGMEKFFEEK